MEKIDGTLLVETISFPLCISSVHGNPRYTRGDMLISDFLSHLLVCEGDNWCNQGRELFHSPSHRHRADIPQLTSKASGSHVCRPVLLHVSLPLTHSQTSRQHLHQLLNWRSFNYSISLWKLIYTVSCWSKQQYSKKLIVLLCPLTMIVGNLWYS